MTKSIVVYLLAVSLVMIMPVGQVNAADAPREIILGVPTSLGTLEGKQSHMAAVLAVEEINKKGGVKVGDGKVPFPSVIMALKAISPNNRARRELMIDPKTAIRRKIISCGGADGVLVIIFPQSIWIRYRPQLGQECCLKDRVH